MPRRQLVNANSVGLVTTLRDAAARRDDLHGARRARRRASARSVPYFGDHPESLALWLDARRSCSRRGWCAGLDLKPGPAAQRERRRPKLSVRRGRRGDPRRHPVPPRAPAGPRHDRRHRHRVRGRGRGHRRSGPVFAQYSLNARRHRVRLPHDRARHRDGRRHGVCGLVRSDREGDHVRGPMLGVGGCLFVLAAMPTIAAGARSSPSRWASACGLAWVTGYTHAAGEREPTSSEAGPSPRSPPWCGSALFLSLAAFPALATAFLPTTGCGSRRPDAGSTWLGTRARAVGRGRGRGRWRPATRRGLQRNRAASRAAGAGAALQEGDRAGRVHRVRGRGGRRQGNADPPGPRVARVARAGRCW